MYSTLGFLYAKRKGQKLIRTQNTPRGAGYLQNVKNYLFAGFCGSFVSGFGKARFFARGRFPVDDFLFGGLVNASVGLFQVFFQRFSFGSGGGLYRFGSYADFFNQPFVSGVSFFSLALSFKGAGVAARFQFCHCNTSV